MKPCELNSFKVRERFLLSKRKSLTREIEHAWNREVPERVRAQSPWRILSALVSDLSGELDPELQQLVSTAISAKSVSNVLSLGARFGSPQCHSDPRSYFAPALLLNLLKKFPWVDADLDPKAKAIERFYAAEQQCKRANRRLNHYRTYGDFGSRPLTKRLDIAQILWSARRKIQNWLGDVEPSEILQHVRHGPGGSVGLKRPYTTPYYKFGVGNYTVSSGAYFLAAKTIASSDVWVASLLKDKGVIKTDYNMSCVPYQTRISVADSRLEVADYNEVRFVPKNASTHRSIAIEPRMNVALQLAVGAIFRKALKRVGCNLDDQSRNQELARIGSISDDDYDPITLDLAMASDTLCIEIVRELLPPEWFELLSDLRSCEGRLGKERIKWEKFSSMGNGFTFELESMIFYALAQAVSDNTDTTLWYSDTFGPAYKYANLSVYGDDIIVPKCVADPLIKVLNFCGFSLNLDKSFTSGPFRESCGKDYFGGVDVRPFYFDRSLSHERDFIQLRNNLALFSEKTSEMMGIVLQKTISIVDEYISPVLKKNLVGVEPLTGDNYIYSNVDMCHRSKLFSWDTDMQGWIGPIVKPKLAVVDNCLPHWRYCQLLYAQTDRRLADDPSTVIDPISRLYAQSRAEADPYRFPMAAQAAAGGSAADVVLSGTVGEGRLHLASLYLG